MIFNIANINLCTESEGPYKRLAIWFQGCHRRCKDCCNQELQEIKPVNLISHEEIINIIAESKKNNKIEGVTLLGGEPTLQKGLGYLCSRIHELEIGVILFTGYLKNEIDTEIIDNVDLIIDGEFIIEKTDESRNMIGSKNQKLHLVTDRYINNLDWFNKKRSKSVDINILDSIYFNGDVI